VQEVDVWLLWLWLLVSLGPVGFVMAWVIISIACLLSAPVANLLIYVFWGMKDMINYSLRGMTKYD